MEIPNVNYVQEDGKDVYFRNPKTNEERRIIYFSKDNPAPILEEVPLSRGNYIFWKFQGGNCAIQRSLDPEVNFVSDPQELREAFRHLGLDYILKEPSKSF